MSEQPQSPESNTPSPTGSSSPWPMPELAAQALSYWVDSWQRTVLFWDVLRERVMLYQGFEEPVFDERPFRLVQQLIRELPGAERPTVDQLKGAVKRQLFTLLLDEERAVNALPRLLPDRQQRQQVLKFVRRVATVRAGQLSAAQERRFQRLEDILGSAGSQE